MLSSQEVMTRLRLSGRVKGPGVRVCTYLTLSVNNLLRGFEYTPTFAHYSASHSAPE